MAGPLRIKICGVTSASDAERAGALGADAIGLNFYPRSPRYVEPQAVPAILAGLPPFVEPVGVFVGQPLADMFALAERAGRLRTVQWYGEKHETTDPSPFRLLPAFPVSDEESLVAVMRHLEACRARGHQPAGVVLDALAPGMYGGTGQTLPWEMLAEFRPGVPVILAGGLTPENVARAVRCVRPYGVDVASGVEDAPGRKNAEKVRQFIERAREAAAD